MKKVVNSVLASALALTVAPMVVGAEEAATTATQMDPGLEKVVKRLEALKLIQGYGNGDYGVERSITRAEFATLVVRAKGLEEGAKLAQFQSNFTDVKPSDWFAGYVNVASGQEIVKGYQDQSFRAGNNVTYAEAVAMIIRSLGYDPAVKGVWPNNYIAKASELGISKGVKVTPDKPATRGDIMIMLDNALTVGLMKQTEYGTDIRFEIYDGKNGYEKKTLLTEYLNVEVYDMDWANNGGNKAKELPFVDNVPTMGLGTLKGNEVGFKAGLKGTYKVADGINVNDFVGQHVQVWVKDDREDYVVWMENSDDEEVLNVRLDTNYFDGKVVTDGSKVKSDKDLSKVKFKFDDGKSYTLADDVKVTYNFQSYKTVYEGIKTILDQDNILKAKVVLNDDGDIAYLDVLDDITAEKKLTGVKYGSSVIEKVDATKQRITNLVDGNFDLKDKEEGKDYLVYLNGKLAKYADLQPMDVYSVYYPGGKKDKFIIMAVRNVVEGKVTKVDARKDGDNRLVIGDKTYRVRTASYSENANKDVEQLSGEKLRDTLRDLSGVEVKLYLGADGRARHVETKDNVNDRRFNAIIKKDVSYDNNDDKYSFVAFTEKGANQTIKIDGEDIEWASTGKDLTDDEIMKTLVSIGRDKLKKNLHVVEVTLNSKGEFDKVKVLDDLELGELKEKDWEKAADEDGNVLNVKDPKTGKTVTYDVTDSTVVFDMTGKVEGKRNELKDTRIAKFKSVADDDDKVVYYATNDGDLDYVFVVSGDAVESDSEYGMIKTFTVEDGDDAVVIVKKDGDTVKEVTYKLDGSVKDAQKGDNAFNRYDFVRYSLNSEDQVIINDVEPIVKGYHNKDNDETPAYVSVTDDLDAADLDDLQTGKVTKVDGNKVTVEYLDENGDKQKTILLTSSSTVYLDFGFESLGGVTEGDYIALVETDDDESRIDYVVKVTDQDEIDDHSEEIDGKIVYDDGYDMSKFLGSSKVVDPDGEMADFTKVSGFESEIMAGLSLYSVTGAKGAIKDTDATVTIEAGGNTYEPEEILADGSFEVVIEDLDSGVKSYKLIVEKDGKKEEKTLSFTKK